MSEGTLAPRLVRRGMELSILSAVLLSVFTATMSGSIFTGLMRSIHFTAPQIGIMTSVPLLFPLMQILGVWLQRNYFNRKHFWVSCSLTQFSLYLVLLALVFGWSRFAEPVGFLFFFFLMNLIGNSYRQLI